MDSLSFQSLSLITFLHNTKHVLRQNNTFKWHYIKRKCEDVTEVNLERPIETVFLGRAKLKGTKVFLCLNRETTCRIED